MTDSKAPFFAPKSTKCRKSTVGLAAVLITIPLVLIGRSGMAKLAASHDIEIPPAEPTPVRVQPVVESVVVAGQRFAGVVHELRKVELSFRVGGTVLELQHVTGAEGKTRDLHEGDRLPQGTLLARLDPADYQRERDNAAEKLAAAESRLKQARADREDAQSAFDRTANLAASKATTVAALDAAKMRRTVSEAAIEVSERDIASARIALQQCDENLRYCELTAPFDQSTVALRAIDAGQRVQAGQRVFVVNDLSSVVVSFAVQDTLLRNLAIGDAIDVTADGLPGQLFRGVVHKIGAVADERSRSYPIEVRIDAPAGLRPGMVATVHLRHERRAALVPLTAIVPLESGKAAVFRVTRDGDKSELRRVPIEIGDVLDNRVAITLDPAAPATGALHAGDEIVATGVHRLREGEPVHVVP